VKVYPLVLSDVGYEPKLELAPPLPPPPEGGGGGGGGLFPPQDKKVRATHLPSPILPHWCPLAEGDSPLTKLTVWPLERDPTTLQPVPGQDRTFNAVVTLQFWAQAKATKSKPEFR